MAVLPPLPPVQPPKRFPFSIVWSPIPLISWLLPFIGHVGVCTAEGVILDFAGPFYISIDAMAFGNPARYARLQPSKAAAVLRQAQMRSTLANNASSAANSSSATSGGSMASMHGSAQQGLDSVSQAWDGVLQQSAGEYQHHNYSFLGDNCHCFVAHALNGAEYGGTRWNMVHVATEVFLFGRYVGVAGVLRTWLPFCIIMPLALYFGRLIFLYCWLGVVALAVGYFAIYTLVAGAGGSPRNSDLC